MVSSRPTAYHPVLRSTLKSWAAHNPIPPTGWLGKWG